MLLLLLLLLLSGFMARGQLTHLHKITAKCQMQTFSSNNICNKNNFASCPNFFRELWRNEEQLKTGNRIEETEKTEKTAKTLRLKNLATAAVACFRPQNRMFILCRSEFLLIPLSTRVYPLGYINFRQKFATHLRRHL